MRKLLPILLAVCLGGGASALVACGDRNQLIPQDDADAINSSLDGVRSGIDEQDCNRAQAEVQQAQERADALPADVDKALKDRLNEGIANLAGRAQEACRETKKSTATTAPTTDTTPTETTATETTATETTPTEPTQPTEPTVPTEPTTPTQPTDTSDTGGVSPGDVEGNAGGNGNGNGRGKRNKKGDD